MSDSTKLPPIGRVVASSETERRPASLPAEQDNTLIGIAGNTLENMDEKMSAAGKQDGKVVPTSDAPQLIKKGPSKSNVPEEL